MNADPPIPKPGVGVNVPTSSLAHFAGGVAGLAKAAIGVDPAPADVRLARRLACSHCAQWTRRRCRICGCLTGAKIRLASESCPLGWWTAVISESNHGS